MDTSEQISNNIVEAKFNQYKQHILHQVQETSICQDPYYLLYIDKIFPDDFYQKLKDRMLEYKYGGKLQDRPQDSKKFLNSRYSLVNNAELEVRYFHALFSDKDIKKVMLEKFYTVVNAKLISALKIHNEFEFIYTKEGRFQNIHIDIPSKFLSFVFYFPEGEVDEVAADRNATIVYDKELSPHYKVKYQDNSLCIFAPHFYSYHGFSSTIDREVLVMFYIHEEEQARWTKLRRQMEDIEPYTLIKDAIENKLEKYPLLEYGTEGKILIEKAACLINAPQGRVLGSN